LPLILTKIEVGSRALYTLVVKKDASVVFFTDVEPASVYLPLIITAVVLLFLSLTKYIYMKVKSQKSKGVKQQRDFELTEDWLNYS
jgi:hypothetical protein